MANPPRSRKRVRALPRAPDGSAFQKCQSCEVLVAIALADMHDCETKKEVKRFKGICEKPTVLKPSVLKQGSGDHHLRSPFRFFMQSFVKMCNKGKLIDIDRKGFEAWKSMSMKARRPYLVHAERVDAANLRAKAEEVNNMLVVDDDEADSAMVGKFDMFYKDHEYSDDETGYESLNTYQWGIV